MKKLRLLITAGPTYEPIDPVRVITNRASGLIGYEIAKTALKMAHRVTLVSGPTKYAPPKGVKFIPVEKASEMRRAVLREFKKADCLIMTAAVADFKIKTVYNAKIKKKRNFSLHLIENRDILKSLPKNGKKIIIGFALETESLFKNAKKKLVDKNMDLIVANRITKKKKPFGEGKKDFLFIKRNTKKPIHFNNVTKKHIARTILNMLKDFIE